MSTLSVILVVMLLLRRQMRCQNSLRKLCWIPKGQVVAQCITLDNESDGRLKASTLARKKKLRSMNGFASYKYI